MYFWTSAPCQRLKFDLDGTGEFATRQSPDSWRRRPLMANLDTAMPIGAEKSTRVYRAKPICKVPPEIGIEHRTSCVRTTKGLRWGCLKSTSRSPGHRAGLFVSDTHSIGIRDQGGRGRSGGAEKSEHTQIAHYPIASPVDNRQYLSVAAERWPRAVPRRRIRPTSKSNFGPLARALAARGATRTP